MLIKRKERENNEKLGHIFFCIIFFILMFICLTLVAEIKTGFIPVYSADIEFWDIPLDPGFTPISYPPYFQYQFFDMNKIMQQQQQRINQVVDWLETNFETSSIPSNYRIRYSQVLYQTTFHFQLAYHIKHKNLFFR